MHIIYANGQPRSFEFALTNTTKAVPTDATILATCSGERVTENLDEYLFGAITDEEFYQFRAMVNEAIERERHTLSTARPVPTNPLRLLWQRLFSA